MPRRPATASQRGKAAIHIRYEKDGTFQRQDRALELWRAGLRFTEIAFELGYADGRKASDAVMSSLRRRDEGVNDMAKEVREEQMAKLSILEEKFLIDLLESDAPDVRIMDGLMRLYKRKAELVGADSAVKLNVVGTSADAMTEDELIVFIRRCEARRKELEGNGANKEAGTGIVAVGK